MAYIHAWPLEQLSMHVPGKRILPAVVAALLVAATASAEDARPQTDEKCVERCDVESDKCMNASEGDPDKMQVCDDKYTDCLKACDVPGG